jgi:sugar lactone lactonase YvrE
LNDAVYLPLEKGRNELLLIVAESFGGWGFMCQNGAEIFEHEDMKKDWELTQTFKYPESVVYDAESGFLYVSNNFNNGNEFISKVKLNGEVEELEWVSGLSRPTGLWVHQNRLYAVERSNLVEIDIASGEIVNRFPVSGSTFINDVAFDDNGNGYITDTRGNAIHRFRDGEFEVWLQGGEITNPNGIYYDGERLIVGTTGDASIKAIRINDKTVTTLTSFEPGSTMDGLRGDGKGNYIISDYNGRVFLVTQSGEKTELLNTTVPPYFCADLEYIPEKEFLVIPTLFDNRIMAYKFTR